MADVLAAIGKNGTHLQAKMVNNIANYTPAVRRGRLKLLEDASSELEAARKVAQQVHQGKLWEDQEDTRKRRYEVISKFQLHEVERNEVMVDAFIKWEDDPNSCSAEEKKLAKEFHYMEREMKLRIVYGDEVEAAAAYFNGGGGGGRMGDAPDNATFEEEQEFRGKKGTHYRRFRQLLPKR